MAKEYLFVHIPRGQMATVLLEMAECKHRVYGFSLSKTLEIPISGIYTVLHRLEVAGFVLGITEEKPGPGRIIPRRYYELTELGHKASKALVLLKKEKTAA